LAKILTEKFSNVHVNLIEHSQKRAAFVAGALPNVTVFHGSALDHNMLKEAAVPEADTVISVMDDDENNVLAGLLSKNLGANFINVLVSNPLYPTILPALGIDAVINPKTITISDVLQYIPTFNVKFIHTFRDHFGSVCKVRLGPNNKFVGKYLRSLTVPDKSILGGVIREGQFMIPDYPDVAQVGDIIIFLVVRSEVQEMKKIFKDH